MGATSPHPSEPPSTSAGAGPATRRWFGSAGSLARATGFKIDDVLRIAKCHPHSPGLRRLEAALELVDAGSESPRESYLRLLLIDAGLPRPQTPIPVLGVDGISG